MDIDDRVAGDDTVGHGGADAGEHRIDELLGDRAADNEVVDGEPLAFFARGDVQDYVAILPLVRLTA